jgi:3D (Asp-Asp-Asp) domain-containing protein
MKSLYGGGAVTAAALIVASFFTYARPSIAETTSPQQPSSQQQTKTEASQTPSTGAQFVAPGPAANTDTVSTRSPMTGKVAEPVDKSPAPIAAAAAPVRPTQTYMATAYSLRGRTASGKYVAKGLIAADPSVLPLGSRVRLDAGPYSGEYLVADTGGAVRGRHIDIWTPSSREAMRFGRRNVKLTVLSLGAFRKARGRRVAR